jgi:hypothetical protein
MKKNKTRKFSYDEQDGIFVLEDEISVNWLATQILQRPNLQITKLSNDDLQKFLLILSESDLRMPNGQYCLFWLKEQLKEKREMAEAKLGENWAKVAARFRFILEQIDQSLITVENLKDKMLLKKEDVNEIKQKKFTSNNMEAHFELLDKEEENGSKV